MKTHTITCESLSKCIHVVPSQACHTIPSSGSCFPSPLLRRLNTYTIGSVNGSWDELRDKFCLSFFPQSRVIALRRDILCFQQNEKESIGAAWARFSLLLMYGPNLSMPDHVLLQHFYIGLDKEFALYLDIAAGGSFSHKTPFKGREILDRITENTSLRC